MNNRNLRNLPIEPSFPDYGIFVLESCHSPDFTMKTRKDDYHKLCLVERGKGTLETGRTRKAIQAQDLFYLVPNQKHVIRDHKENPLTLIMVCFRDTLFDTSSHFKKLLENVKTSFSKQNPFRLQDSYRLSNVIKTFKAMIFEQTEKRQSHDARIIAILQELLVFTVRTMEEYSRSADLSPRDRAFHGSLSYIRSNFFESIQITDLARLAGMSPRSYTQYFKSRTGKTVLKYITDTRVEYAKKRLCETGNIAFAALEAGFNDLSNFYRVFKKYTGKTPKQFLEP
jgi:AraC-like DNA-binding protein